MSCDYCWPGNCCGGPNCQDADETEGRALARAKADASAKAQTIMAKRNKRLAEGEPK